MYFTDTVSQATDDEAEYDEESFYDDEDDVHTERAPSDDSTSPVAGNLVWDEDLSPGPADLEAQPDRVSLPPPQAIPRRSTDRTIVPTRRSPSARETTPLLRKHNSLTFVEPAVRTFHSALPTLAVPVDSPPTTVRRASYASVHSASERRGSNASKLAKAAQLGKSTYGQTVCPLHTRRVTVSLTSDRFSSSTP